MFTPVLQIPVIGMEVDQFALLFITALAGGAFGASLGALPAFIFTGFVVFLGEVTQRIFYSHSGTHVDPPAMAIAIVMLFVGVLYRFDTSTAPSRSPTVRRNRPVLRRLGRSSLSRPRSFLSCGWTHR